MKRKGEGVIETKQMLFVFFSTNDRFANDGQSTPFVVERLEKKLVK
jgi:hypothetical protein